MRLSKYPLMLLVVALSLAPWAVSGAAAETRAARAAALYERALEHLQRNTVDTRRIGIDELEQATLLAPDQPGYELALARAYLQIGFLRRARERFERVARLTPDDPESRYGLGLVWRRDWLKYLDATSLAHAVTHLSAAVRLKPSFCDAWLMLAPLLVEQNQLTAAAAAAEHAAEADPRRLEARIAEAYTSYRLGLVTRAESLFTATIPQLDRMMRDRFDDIAPVASERDTAVLRRLPAARKAAFVRDFWKEHDPDLATPENEAQLEYWSRVSHAYFIYWDAHRRTWDERGELYVRYGRPDVADYNPVNAKLYVVSPLGRPFPANILVWAWPQLGMIVTLQDRLLSEYYQLPISLDHDMDPRPDPDSLSRDHEILASRGGRGVFPLLPPGATRRPIAGVVARFAGGPSARLLAQLATPAGPGDSLTAEWVVLDSAQAEVARARRALVPSACDPTEDQVADFATELPAGRYMVGMTVRDRDGGRGVFRAPVTIGPAGDELRLSDVVVACGLDPGIGSGGAPPAVRIEPNPSARVKGSDPLTAYFEIYHLSPGADGRARFEYVYTVSSAARDTRNWFLRTLQPRPQPPPISASRIETQAGDLRRQFVRVPVESLPPGRYRLEITVRDLVAGTEARRIAPFERVSEPPAARD